MLEDYAIRLRTGRAYLKRTEWRNPGHKKYAYKETYQTKSGEFTPEEWKKKAMQEICREGRMELLESIKQHCRQHCAWLHKENEIEEYAISCLCSGAYKNWKDFGENTIIWM